MPRGELVMALRGILPSLKWSGRPMPTCTECLGQTEGQMRWHWPAPDWLHLHGIATAHNAHSREHSQQSGRPHPSRNCHTRGHAHSGQSRGDQPIGQLCILCCLLPTFGPITWSPQFPALGVPVNAIAVPTLSLPAKATRRAVQQVPIRWTFRTCPIATFGHIAHRTGLPAKMSGWAELAIVATRLMAFYDGENALGLE